MSDGFSFASFSAPGTQPDATMTWYAPGTVNPALAGSQKEPVPFGFDEAEQERRELA